MKLLIALSAALLLQDPGTTLTLGDQTEKLWSIKGHVELPEASEIALQATRIERTWDARVGKFVQAPAAEKNRIANADVSRKSFSTEFKAGPIGLYRVRVMSDGQALHTEQMALGKTVKMLAVTEAKVPEIVRAIDKAKEWIVEMEKIAGGDQLPTLKRREEVTNAMTKERDALLTIQDETDLTASLKLLRDMYWHLINAQIWKVKSSHPAADNDAVNNQKGFFMDESLTFAMIKASLKILPQMMSVEARVSIALLVEHHLQKLGDKEPATAAAKAIAKAGEGVNEVVPEPGKEFGEWLKDVATEADLADTLKHFNTYWSTRVVFP